MHQGCAEKAREELKANRENEQQRVAECLDLAMCLRELRPGDIDWEPRTSHQDEQQSGAKSRHQAQGERESHRGRVGS